MKTNIILTAIMIVFMMVIAPLAIAEENADIATVDENVADTTAVDGTVTDGVESSLTTLEPAIETTSDSEIAAETLDTQTTQEIDDDLDESVSGAKVAWARFGLWFTFNQEKKAQKELKLARLELIRAKVAAISNNSEAMEQALASHDELINNVKERINNIDGESTSQGVKESAVKLIGLERAIEVHELRIQKLNEILSSSDLSEEQIEKIQERLAKVEENTAKLREVKEAKKEKIKIRFMVVNSVTEDQAEIEIKNLEHVQNLNAVKKRIAEARIAHAEKTLEKLNEKAVKSQEKGKDTSKINSKIANLEQGIGQARTLVQSGEFKRAAIELKDSKRQENIRDKLKSEDNDSDDGSDDDSDDSKDLNDTGDDNSSDSDLGE